MNNSYFEKEYEINSVMINMKKNLGLYGVLGLLQDVGTIHAELMGLGFEAMIKNNAFWVFTQHKLLMKQWPKWQDKVLIKTWPRKIQGLKAYRDYTIYLNGERIGESVATFMVLDGSTRKPVKPRLDNLLYDENKYEELNIIPEKVKLPDSMELANTLYVRNSDLDMNNHVNNTKYSQWILDTIHIDYHHNFLVSEFDINFLSECRLGDTIDIFMSKDEVQDRVKSFYQGIRKSDQKTVFVAHISGLKLSPS